MTTCTCKYRGPGQAMNSTGCEVHTKPQYRCEVSGCGCGDYYPQSEPKQSYWPLCTCGHAAQEHN